MTAQEILKAIEANKKNYRYFGIRRDDRVFKIGEELPHSYDWNTEDEELDGTCATGFGHLWFDGEQDDIDTVQAALDVNEMYDGENIYLIAGWSSEYGNDEDEIIINGAEVVAIAA